MDRKARGRGLLTLVVKDYRRGNERERASERACRSRNIISGRSGVERKDRGNNSLNAEGNVGGPAPPYHLFCANSVRDSTNSYPSCRVLPSLGTRRSRVSSSRGERAALSLGSRDSGRRGAALASPRELKDSPRRYRVARIESMADAEDAFLN